MSISIIPQAELEAISRILGDTSHGFTGSEIERLLSACDMRDPGPITKWVRIFEACTISQQTYNSGNHVGRFIEESMRPARWIKNKELWKQKQNDLNVILSLLGISLNDSGKLVSTTKTFTIDQALSKVKSLKDKLTQRNTHAEIFKYCTKELLVNNYFHAVFESCKGIADRISHITGINKDGAELVDVAFSLNNPLVAINTLQSDSERSEHKGFANLLRGVFGMIRNPLAHDPKLNWDMTEQDALDIFAMLSMIHRKIDKMVLIPKH